MKYSNVKTILLNITRAKRSSVINVVGLSFGFAVLLSIFFFIREELNYNLFHDEIDNIYCVFTKDHNTKDELGWNESVPAMAEAFRTEFPEVQDAALYYNGTLRMLVDYNGKKFYEQVQLADPNLFHIFTFPLVKGEIPKNSDKARVVALSRKLADKYFGKEDPIGKTFKIDNKDLFTVVAVFDNIPSNSSIQFDFWAPIKLLEEIEGPNYLKTWSNLSFSTYALLSNNASLSGLNKKLYGRIQQVNPNSSERSQLYPFKDLYLKAWNHKNGIRMMSMIAFVILTLVCINFINLQTAEAFDRIKDFGLKRINGASNLVIIKQLIGEALTYCIVSLIIAIGLTQLCENYLFDLLGKSASGASILSVYSLLFIVSVAFFIAFLSGFIPGMIIKSVSPCNSIKNKVKEQVGVKNLRVVFTSLQFCMAIVLVICLLATNKQLNYLRNKNLGFQKDQIVYVHIEGKLKEKKELLREELTKNPSVISATLTSRSPIGIYWNGGGWNWDGKPEDFRPQITYIETDEHFRKTFGIEMLEGDYFESGNPGVVINETFAKMISPNGDALNKLLVQSDENIKITVTGVIKDIHFKPLTQKITPLMMIPQLGYDEMRYLFMKLSPENMDKTLAFIGKTVSTLNPDFPCEYFFLDEDFGRLYKGEERLRNQMMFFSVMAILISCMGLFGILMFMVKQRTKEIGIRKVNGARISEVLVMLNKDFVKWVAIAFIVATPLAYYAMHKWLENFAYKTTLSWWIFALAGLLALGIALLTVSFQSWKAATRNPVEALRYE